MLRKAKVFGGSELQTVSAEISTTVLGKPQDPRPRTVPVRTNLLGCLVAEQVGHTYSFLSCELTCAILQFRPEYEVPACPAHHSSFTLSLRELCCW